MKLMHVGSSSCWGHWGKQPQHWVCKGWEQQGGGIPAGQSSSSPTLMALPWAGHLQPVGLQSSECSRAGDLGVSQSQVILVWGTSILHHWKQLLSVFKMHTSLKSSSVCLHLTPYVSLRRGKHQFSLTEILHQRMNLCLPFSPFSVSRIALWVIHLVEYDHAANIWMCSIKKINMVTKPGTCDKKCQTN